MLEVSKVGRFWYVDSRSRHILGDWIFSQSGRFESFRRAQLLLELDDGDTMCMFEGEDAEVLRADGTVEHWQMKRAGARQERRLFTSFFERASAAPSSERWVLVTNEELRGIALTDFGEAAGRCACALVHETWPFDPVAGAARVRAALLNRLDEAVPDADPRSVVRESDVTDCMGDLAALHDEMQAGERVVGSHVRTKTWGKLVKGIGPLRGFASWRSLGQSGVAAATEELLHARDVFSREDTDFTSDLGAAALGQLKIWLEDPRPQASVLLLRGPSGCGKTWTLAQAAAAAARQIPVYCSDVEPLASVELDAISRWAGGPCMVVLDDLVEREWQAIVAAARASSHPLLVLAATSVPANQRGLALLRRYYAEPRLCEVHGEHLLTATEREQIRTYRGNVLTLAERDRLAQANVRSALRWLQRAEGHLDDAGELADAAVRSEAVLAFVVAAAVGVRSPAGILRVFVGDPEDVKWLRERSLQRIEAGEQMLWVENKEAAKAALELLAEEDPTLDARMHDLAARILDEVASTATNATYRTFVRRLLRNASAAELLDVRGLLTDRRTSVATVVEAEDRPAFAYGWLELLVEADPALSLEIARNSLGPRALPRNAADIAVLGALEGDERAAGVLREVTSKGPIDLTAAALALEMAEQVRGSDVLKVSRGVLEIISSASIAFVDLLGVRNTSQLLPRLVLDRGTPGQREWLVERIFPALIDDGPARFPKPWVLVPPALEVFERVLMQQRTWTVRSVPRHIQNALAGIGPTLEGRLSELQSAMADEVATEERRFGRDMPFPTAIKQVRELLDMPNRAANPIVALLSFARAWGEEQQVQEIAAIAWRMLAQRLSEGLPIEHVQGIVHELSDEYWLARGGLDAPGLILRAVCATRGSSLRSLFAVAGYDLREGLRVPEASHAITEYARHGPGNSAIRAYLESLRVSSDLDSSTENKLAADYANLDHREYGASFCLPRGHLAARSLELDPDGFAREVWDQWEAVHQQRTNVFSFCVRLRALETAKQVLTAQPFWPADLPFHRATVAALVGEANRARHAVWSARIQPSGEGAHPGTINRAYRALAAATSGPESELWQIAAELTWPHRLQRTEVLLRPTKQV